MGDVHIPAPDPNRVGAKVDELIAAGHELYVSTVTGSGSGRARRPTLFLLAFIGLWGAADDWKFSLLGLIAIALLALSDSVVEL